MEQSRRRVGGGQEKSVPHRLQICVVCCLRLCYAIAPLFVLMFIRKLWLCIALCYMYIERESANYLLIMTFYETVVFTLCVLGVRLQQLYFCQVVLILIPMLVAVHC